MPDPCIIPAEISRKVDVKPSYLVQCDRVAAEVRHQPVIDIVRNIQVRHFAQECSMTHRVEGFAEVECDHDNILMCC